MLEADRFSVAGRAPWLVSALAAAPYGVKRWMWRTPSAWRAAASACRRLGWSEDSLGWYAAPNGPWAGIKIRALHRNHLWVPLGGYEPEVSVWALRTLRDPRWFPPGLDVYDVGANCGLMSMLFARAGAKVLAFEPSPSNQAHWRANLALNPELAAGAVLLPFAIGAQDEEVKMTFGEAQSANQLVVDGVRLWEDAAALPTVKVRVRPLDALLDDPPAGLSPRPGFIKIDIEGAEGLALAGAAETLRRFRPSLLVETHNDDACAATFDRLRAADYALWRFDGGTLKPIERPWPGGYGHVAALPRERA